MSAEALTGDIIPETVKVDSVEKVASALAAKHPKRGKNDSPYDVMSWGSSGQKSESSVG